MYDQRPWLKLYPPGVPSNINPDQYPLLIDLFKETFDKYRNKKAFNCMGAELTFNQIDKYSANFAAYLHS
ncbi:MAG: long-chain-fatty-acid--CoA ligase, partial [Saprospiraceae bacterium]|nr:long-chain-fatty-acid--CoA ligase [Saprospiraceae bacterium]